VLWKTKKSGGLIISHAKELAEITGKVGGRKKACEKIIELLGASYRGRKLLGGQALVDPI